MTVALIKSSNHYILLILEACFCLIVCWRSRIASELAQIITNLSIIFIRPRRSMPIQDWLLLLLLHFADQTWVCVLIVLRILRGLRRNYIDESIHFL